MLTTPYGADPFESMRGQPRFRLYTTGQVFLAGVLGGGVGGWRLLADNLDRLGRRGGARWARLAMIPAGIFSAAGGWLTLQLFSSLAPGAGRPLLMRWGWGTWLVETVGAYARPIIMTLDPAIIALTVSSALSALVLFLTIGGVLRSHFSRAGRAGRWRDWLRVTAATALMVWGVASAAHLLCGNA